MIAEGQDEVTMKLDLVAWGDPIGGLSLKEPKASKVITAQSFSYSEPVSYSGPRLLEIHQSGSGEVEELELPGTPEDEEHASVPLPLPEPDAEADNPGVSHRLTRLRKEKPTLVALARLPANTSRATILLAAAAEGTYRAHVINDDPDKLPLGSLRIHNLSAFRIAIEVPGREKHELEPGARFRVKAPDGSVTYRLSYFHEGEWTVQENNMIPVPPDQQTQFIILQSNNRFFLSADGSRGGFLQSVTLRREL